MPKPKDFAFLFKPGDYLRDTQCLSSDVQVAYDRIMCEMLRNICLTKQRLEFFTKRLTEDQKIELLNVIEISGDQVFIPWVKLSIEERISYCDSRRKNRLKKQETHEEHMLSHDSHMDSEGDSEEEDIIRNKEEGMQGEKISDPLWYENSDAGFQEYLRISEPEWDALQENWEWIAKMKYRHPKTNIRESMEKSWDDYWGCREGWHNKREAYEKAKKKAKKDKVEFSYQMNWEKTIQKTLQFSRVPILFGTIDVEEDYLKRMEKNDE